jgi:imidazolonepropionase-like amidohydrolase
VPLALTGATIYVDPQTEPIADGVIVIDAGRIADVGTRAGLTISESMPTLDCSGLIVTAGFWNCHVHFFEQKWADAATLPAAQLASQFADYARHGFTIVVDLSSKWTNTQALRARISSGELIGPRIRSTGEGLIPPGALPPDSVLESMGLMKTPLPEVRDTREAVAATRALLQSGVDAIKMFASGSSPESGALSSEVMRVVVDEAHANGRRVFVHPNSADEIARALDAGVDAIAHTTPRSPWNDALLSSIARRRPAVTPTLMLWKQHAEDAVHQLRAWIANGGTVLFGTDAGAVPIDPAQEFALMGQAGMNFRDVLATLTTAPAAFFGQTTTLGRIARGYQADLVALEGAAGAGSLTRVRYTLQAGILVR